MPGSGLPMAISTSLSRILMLAFASIVPSPSRPFELLKCANSASVVVPDTSKVLSVPISRRLLLVTVRPSSLADNTSVLSIL